MEQRITDKGEKILSAVESKLGRCPSQEDIDTVYQVLKDQGLSSLAQGATARHVFALPDTLVTDGAVLKIPARETDFFETYSLDHLGVDQNIRAVYTAKYLSEDGLTPPVIDYSNVGSWVAFPIVNDLTDDEMDEFERKSSLLREREDLHAATQREVSETPDVAIPESWGIYDGEVVLRDAGSIYVDEEKAPDLELPNDPIWTTG